MKDFFKKHPEGTLIALAVVFSAFIFFYFIGGMTTAAGAIDGIFTVNKNATADMTFNLTGAAQLDLRGLVQ